MANPNGRIWPPEASRTVTVRMTEEQFVRWATAASRWKMRPHLGAWIAQAADVYAELILGRLWLIRRPEREADE